MMIDSYVFLVLVKLGWNVTTFYRCKVLCDQIFLLHKGQIMVDTPDLCANVHKYYIPIRHVYTSWSSTFVREYYQLCWFKD